MSAEATAARDRYLASFARFEEGLNGQRDTPAHSLRRAAIERFAAVGFPTTRDEEWRFTNVAPIARTPFQPAPRLDPDAVLRAEVDRWAAGLLGETAGALLVFVNGFHSPALSSVGPLPAGVRVGSLSEALQQEPSLVGPHLARLAGPDGPAFTALNTAFMRDGALVHLGRGAALEKPVHLLYLTHAGPGEVVTHPRTLIVAEELGQATVIETFAGTDSSSYFTNAVTEVSLAANAVVDHYRLQEEGAAAYHVSTLQARLERDAVFSTQAFLFGGAISRSDVNASLEAEGCECTLNGLYLGAAQQLVDNHTRIDHAQPHCNSHELYKGILADQARGVFNGKIYVHPDAQKTDAKQTNQTLLLSEEAQINTKPQLEIFADDVRCTHGATVGQLDEDAIFYLRARGIPAEAARALLTYAFASEVVERVKPAPLRELLEARIFARLGGGPAPGERA